MTRGSIAWFVATFVCACTPPSIDSAASCEEAKAGVTIVPACGGTDWLVNEDLLVQGIATHGSGLAIHKILVAGIPAKNDGFNFDAWSAVVPLPTLKMRTTEGTDLVNLPIIATDVCREQFAASCDVRLGVPVTALDILPDYPGEEQYLPSDGTTAVALTITADPQAAGAKVKLKSTEGGSFLGLSGDTVTLGGDKQSAASASILFTSNKAGTAFITASADDETVSLPIIVAGPPTLLPPAADLSPGQTFTITVDTDGRIDECQATPAAGIMVTSGGQDLMATPAAADQTGDGKPDIEITADPTLTAEVKVTVTCRDPFGQWASGTYMAAP